MNEARQIEIMSIIVEALLYTSSPSFIMNERGELEYLSVLEELKDSNPHVFKALELTNIELFNDKDAIESPFISNVQQILGDKLSVVDALE